MFTQTLEHFPSFLSPSLPSQLPRCWRALTTKESATPGINRPYILVSHSSAADRDDEEDVGVQAEATTLEATMAATLGLLGKKSPHCLRVHIFQCRSLPSSEASGLLDPYIKVSIAGVTADRAFTHAHLHCAGFKK